MSVLALGVSHRTADLALLERLAIPADELPKVLRSLLALDHVIEAAALSTCNRVEVYVHATMFHPAVDELREWLSLRAEVEPETLDECAFWFYDDRAAAHLFEVAGGLDSMIIGERQIALQVKDAMEAAREEGAARRVLQRLFRQAVYTGRRVRNETAIDEGASSIVDVGLDLVTDWIDGGVADQRVLIVGAGKIGGLTADRLVKLGAPDVRVWNRSADKAARLAARVEGDAVARSDLAAAVATADVVVCTTGAPVPLLDHGTVAAAVEDRDDELVILDLAVPRNVDPACRDIGGVALLDIADVRTVADREVTGEVIEAAGEIVEEEARRFLAWQRAWKVEPTIKALRLRAEAVREAELERLDNKLGDLDADEREAVEAVTKGILNTLLHEPTVRLKELADAGGAEHYANAVRELFDLDE